MGWTTPTDRSTGYVVTATDWNIVEDDLSFLYGDTGWTNASGFTNSWTSGVNTARFLKSGNFVKLGGVITGGTLNTAAFTLPVGYRPSQQVGFATSAGSAFALIEVNTSGTVVPAVGSTTNVFMDVVMFSIL